MATFAGTTQKCKACEKTVYLVDQLTADSKVYHKACFRCHHCKGTLKVIPFILSFFFLCVAKLVKLSFVNNFGDAPSPYVTLNLIMSFCLVLLDCGFLKSGFGC